MIKIYIHVDIILSSLHYLFLPGAIPYKRIGCFKNTPSGGNLGEGEVTALTEKQFKEDKGVFMQPFDLSDVMDDLICK